MCQLGSLTKSNLTYAPVEGYRGWGIKNPFDNKEKFLFPLNRRTNEPFLKQKNSTAIIDKPFKEKISGFYAYSYNDYDYNYNNNYNYNYNHYNYTNYSNYNYNHYNYTNYSNYNNNYNYNYNYFVTGKILLSGAIAHHEQGYRATKGKPILLVTLDINGDDNFTKFKTHFNNCVESLAKEYGAKTCTWTEFKDA